MEPIGGNTPVLNATAAAEVTMVVNTGDDSGCGCVGQDGGGGFGVLEVDGDSVVLLEVAAKVVGPRLQQKQTPPYSLCTYVSFHASTSDCRP